MTPPVSGAIADPIHQQAESLSAEVCKPFPASRKVYQTGSRPDLRVPMREVALTGTRTQ